MQALNERYERFIFKNKLFNAHNKDNNEKVKSS